ncbi:MAG: tRNA (uridine(54)-C5)-methyltransferase TrmA [Sulfurospirillum sp.]|nr:tRNA (uridine(54)-C5)-methyltransferase TrmA [Sulfurospirillum sp.]
MNCIYFGICGSCTLYDKSYEEQLAYKKESIKELFKALHVNDFPIFPSPSTHYRSRAEFRIWHDGRKISYAMSVMDKKSVVCIENCPKVVKSIYNLMPKLKTALENNEILSHKLFAVEFLNGTSGILVSLLYHKQLDDNWQVEASKLCQTLSINIIGRAKKQKRVIGSDSLTQSLHVEDKEFVYTITEGGFSQPNNNVNTQMIQWVCSHVGHGKDLLELYCGHGNFTLPMAGKFSKVLATEIAKSSITSAQKSAKQVGINNINFLRMSVEDLTSALNGEREFNRLREIDLDSFHFSHVLVDPPRAGIDEKSLTFLKRFDKIIYISCNPQTLKRDIEFLNYKIEDFALFDQFPHTLHVEAGAILAKKF